MEKHSLLITQLLDQCIKIQITDKREFIGLLRCLDHQCNLVLQNVIERRQDPITYDFCYRELPMVMIPGQHLKKIEIESKQWEFIST